MSRPPPANRLDFRWFLPITTRFMDNDAFAHVNNVIYYSWIDTAVNRFLMDRGLLDLQASPVIGIVAESGCRYRAQIAYPDDVTVGLRIDTLGNSSVRYGLGIFRADEDVASAEGHFVHVYVDRASMRPVPIPDHIRAVMQTITLEGAP